MLICTKPKQIDAWINNNKDLWEFWQTVILNESWVRQGKTKEEVIALSNYYEGCYDMACNFKHIVKEFQ